MCYYCTHIFFLDCRNRFGWHIYFFNLIVYLLFITSLSICVIYHRYLYADHYFQRDVNIGLKLRPQDNSESSMSDLMPSVSVPSNTDLNNNVSDLNGTVNNINSTNEAAFRQTVGINLN